MNPAPPDWYYVYLLEDRGGSIYIGCTSDLHKRMQEHKNGKVYSTKRMSSMQLVYFEAYRLKEDAFKREKHLKYYGSGLRNLKLRLRNSLRNGGAG